MYNLADIRQHGYWASLRIEPDLISQIKEAQKEDSKIWTIVENLDKQVEFHLDNDNVLWQDTRLVVPNDASLREALLTEAHSSPFSVHPVGVGAAEEGEGMEQEEALHTLKDNLYNAPILSLPDGPEDFVVYCDSSNQGLCCVLMQRGK
nr:putative reverse transcriptase domain-containing protein [Tanacetum cinerariifolium]